VPLAGAPAILSPKVDDTEVIVIDEKVKEAADDDDFEEYYEEEEKNQAAKGKQESLIRSAHAPNIEVDQLEGGDKEKEEPES